MEKEKLLQVVNTAENASNNDLFTASETLKEEWKKTKELIIELTRHMDGLSEMHKKVETEYNKRKQLNG